MKTTLIKKRGEMRRQPLTNCHDDVLAPGVSIGLHTHDKEEYYYIISGKGTMTLNGERSTIEAGDITAIYPGGSHALVNDSDEDLRVLVIGLR